MIELAAARHAWRAPQAEDACWADLEQYEEASSTPCGRQQASDLGLCAEHLAELFGIQAEAGA